MDFSEFNDDFKLSIYQYRSKWEVTPHDGGAARIGWMVRHHRSKDGHATYFFRDVDTDELFALDGPFEGQLKVVWRAPYDLPHDDYMALMAENAKPKSTFITNHADAGSNFEQRYDTGDTK